MEDDRPFVGDNITEATQPATPRGLSRQDAKRIRNLHSVAIRQMTDGRERSYRQMAEDLQFARERLDNACSLLVAVVRRHGEQVFDMTEVMNTCPPRDVAFTHADGRITVKLRSKPRDVDTD